MYIISSTSNDIELIRSKYLLLELDTLEFPDGKTIETYAVIERDSIPMQEITMLDSLRDLHTNLIKNYRLQNWNFCKQACDHLSGCFKGELDSFYEIMRERVETLETATIDKDWNGNVLSSTMS